MTSLGLSADALGAQSVWWPGWTHTGYIHTDHSRCARPRPTQPSEGCFPHCYIDSFPLTPIRFILRHWLAQKQLLVAPYRFYFQANS